MIWRTIIAALLMLLSLNCTSVKTASTSQINNLPSPDSFKTADLLFLPPDKQLLYFQNIDQILPTNTIEAGRKKHRLIEAFKDFNQISFTYKDTVRTVEEFMQATNVVG